MVTILHISDLHRTSGPRVRNDELLAAILSDAGRWDAEGIPSPDVIVASGDLIQGAGPTLANPGEEITRQYEEAADLLSRLAAHFVNDDRSRVVIVPGNHDVNWERSAAAMVPVTPPNNIRTAALESDSRMRWDWRDQRALEIVDSELYESRLEHFRRFRLDFYEGLNPSPLAHDKDLAFFDYSSTHGLVVVGFSSLYGNDCFCHVGDIETRLIALSRTLLETSDAPVALAVWHHNVAGGPRTHDYMDQRVLHRLIDFGFTVGLHGHQHHPGAAPFELRLPNLTSMVVVGAGSLAVGDAELPMGERRQFNVVVIDPDAELVTVHVRAMSAGGIFSGSHRDDFGGNTYLALPLPVSPARPKPPSATAQLDAALAAVAQGEYQRALQLVGELGEEHAPRKRQVMISALEALGELAELAQLLDPPQSAEELVKLIAVRIDQRDYAGAGAALDSYSRDLDAATERDLRELLEARRMMPDA